MQCGTLLCGGMHFEMMLCAGNCLQKLRAGNVRAVVRTRKSRYLSR